MIAMRMRAAVSLRKCMIEAADLPQEGLESSAFRGGCRQRYSSAQPFGLEVDLDAVIRPTAGWKARA